MVHRKWTGLVVGGAITFGLSWGLASLVGFSKPSSDCTENCDSRSAFFIPVAGPAVWAAGHPHANGAAISYSWSLIEAGGLAMLVVGLVGHDVPQRRVSERGLTLHVVPMLARDSRGVALTARW